ncbi:MAG TPA: molybdenum cofactor guanylyltransferase [Longimicrobiales bacterium]|nr:molybdenum cofactor guanylyltransferase [Longimicrobiales bacterium]
MTADEGLGATRGRGAPSAAGSDGDEHGFLGAVLAGGRNTRYGDHKALAEVGGVPIAARAARALGEAGCHPVVLIANEPGVYAPLGLPLRSDARAGLGPLGGIHAALLWVRDEGLPGAVVVAGDMPFAAPELLRELARRAAAPGVDAAVPESPGKRGVEPLCAAYAVSCLPAVEAAVAGGGGRIVGFYESISLDRVEAARVARFGDPGVMFRNVNTPADRAAADRLHEAAP